MARKTTKVAIPKNVDDLLLLLAAVSAKNEADGATSPLLALNMAAMKDHAASAKAAQTKAKELQRLAEIQTATRDEALGSAQTPGSALFVLTQARDLLLTLYKDNPKKLGEWGFTVSEGEVSTPRPKPAPTPPRP